MKDFCYHCGRELNGNEERCPECGKPTGFVSNNDGSSNPSRRERYVPQEPPRSNINPRKVAIVALLLICLLGVILLPQLTNTQTTESYNVSITVEEISISDNSKEKVYGDKITSYIKVSSDGMKTTETLGTWADCPTNGTVKPITEKNQVTIKYSGKLDDLKLSVYFFVVTKWTDKGDISHSDYVDVYSIDGSVSGDMPKYAGCSGVVFSYSEIKDNYVTLKGDSDPIGTVKLKITAVKS